MRQIPSDAFFCDANDPSKDYRSLDGEQSEQAIEELVRQLKVVPWRGPENHCSPMCWDFAFTDPMVQILQAGAGAQGVLLRHISDKTPRLYRTKS